jgi:chemotaxis family two-component system response regulator Rcp1
VFLIRDAIEGTKIPVDLVVVKDGEKAIAFFDQADADIASPCPALIILDINLPRKQGGEVLQRIRQSHKCGNAPVIVVSTSGSEPDRDRMAKLGANHYFCKPSEYDAFMRLGDIVEALLRQK